LRSLKEFVKRLASKISVTSPTESIEDLKETIRLIEKKIPGWEQRKEAIEKYSEISSTREKILTSWKNDIFDHVLDLANKEDPMEQDLLLRELTDCLEGLSLVKDWKITAKGHRFLNGHRSELDICQCGGQFQEVERNLRYLIIEDFDKISFSSDERWILRPDLQDTFGKLAETGAKVITSLRTGN